MTADNGSAERRIRWGILATGGIARGFVTDLRLLPDAEVVAVGSRSQEAAEAFGEANGVPRRHGSYAALAADEQVDVVYVATPHPSHVAAAMLAIEAGKAVLVEKPFTVNADEAARLVEAARSRGVFLMEAMWTRFLPHVVRIRSLLAEGAIGAVRTVVADHGQWFEEDEAHRLFAPSLGGGALLDLGIYPLSFATMVLGVPAGVTAIGTPAFTGVDAQTSMLLSYASGAHAVLTTTLSAISPTRAVIVGTEGRIEVPGRFFAPTGFSLIRRDGRRDGAAERYDEPHEGKGLRHQAAEVMRCLRAGRLESDVMPLDETVAIMATMDEVRRQIGLTYPAETAGR